MTRQTKPQAYMRTDLGNAERFAAQHAERVRYCWGSGRWLVWCGTHWQTDTSGLVCRLAARTARSLYREAADCDDADERDALIKWGKQSESRTRLDAMLALARAQNNIAVDIKSLDNNNYLFNCRSGTINLRTGELQPHNQADLITRCAPTEYDPNASVEQWRSFVGRIFDGDNGLIGFVQRMLGMALTGDISEQFLFICHGTGANGKSVLLDTVAAIVGDYAGSAAPDLLVSGKHSEHPTELADLQGRRLVVASETEHGAPLRLQLVKRLTGDARIKARRMRQDFFEFPRTHKLVLVTNNRPRVQEDSEAVWRRLRLIPFNVTIPAEERDAKLIDKLRGESAGILAWLVQGCLNWQHNGLQSPRAVLAATAAYRDESDPLADFIQDCCQLDENAWTATADIRAAYEQFCHENGQKPLGATRFRGAMRRHGLEPSRTWQGRGWQGLTLVSESTMSPHDATARFPSLNPPHEETNRQCRHGATCAGENPPNWYEH